MKQGQIGIKAHITNLETAIKTAEQAFRGASTNLEIRMAIFEKVYLGYCVEVRFEINLSFNSIESI
jgi:hypothetical protein